MEIKTLKKTATALAVIAALASLGVAAVLYLDPYRQSRFQTRTVQVTVDAKTLAGNDVYAIIEPVWAAVDVYASDTQYRNAVRRFSQGQRYLLALQFYRGEMADGGHHAMLSNASNAMLEDALAALKALKLDDAAAVFAESWHLAGGPLTPADDRYRRLGSLHPDEFSALDDRYHQLDRGDTIDAAALSFARTHPEQFYFTGPVRKGIEQVGP